MNTDLESVVGQVRAQFRGIRVGAFRNKVERRTKSQTGFQLHHAAAAVPPPEPFHIMCENQGELLSLRPSPPTFRLLSRTPIDRPRVREPPPPVVSSPSSKSRAKPPGQKGFEAVITVSYPHN